MKKNGLKLALKALDKNEMLHPFKSSSRMLVAFLLFASTLFSTASLRADGSCVEEYLAVVRNTENPKLVVAEPTKEAVEAVRKQLVHYLKAAGIPAFVRQTANGDLPIILLNNETYSKLGYILDESLGMAVSLHPGGRTDHGMFRNRTKLIDLYNPGERMDSGEFHYTGIAWKDLSAYLPRRSARSRKILDLSYLLSKEERNSADYYHRVRRGVIFRAPYANWGGKMDDTLPQFLCQGAEHCYTFPNAASGTTHVSEMIKRLKALGVDQPRDLLKTGEGKGFAEAVKARVLNTNVDDPGALYYRAILDHPDVWNAFNALPSNKALSGEEKIEAMAYLVGIHSTDEYLALLQTLKIQGGYSNILQYDNPRATALFIYDDDPASVQKFLDATYETKSDNYKFERDAKNKAIE